MATQDKVLYAAALDAITELVMKSETQTNHYARLKKIQVAIAGEMYLAYKEDANDRPSI